MSRFAAEKEAGHDMPNFSNFDAGKPPQVTSLSWARWLAEMVK